jgi:hypothetical protein
MQAKNFCMKSCQHEVSHSFSSLSTYRKCFFIILVNNFIKASQNLVWNLVITRYHNFFHRWAITESIFYEKSNKKTSNSLLPQWPLVWRSRDSRFLCFACLAGFLIFFKLWACQAALCLAVPWGQAGQSSQPAHSAWFYRSCVKSSRTVKFLISQNPCTLMHLTTFSHPGPTIHTYSPLLSPNLPYSYLISPTLS